MVESRVDRLKNKVPDLIKIYLHIYLQPIRNKIAYLLSFRPTGQDTGTKKGIYKTLMVSVYKHYHLLSISSSKKALSKFNALLPLQ